MKEKEVDLEHQCYIDAIVRLLGKADLHKVDLVWIYASHLIDNHAYNEVKTND